jgi:tyrosyl-tRNA synthetase
MGKTADGAVWLNADMLKPYDYWQYWRNTEDADVGRFLKLFTTLPMDEIRRLEKLEGSEINEAKKILAHEATKLCHGEQAAIDAATTAQKVFEQGGVGDDLPTVLVSPEAKENPIVFLDLLITVGFVSSRGEARRLIEGGGARLNDVQITRIDATVNPKDWTSEGYIKLSAGKKKHALVKIK